MFGPSVALDDPRARPLLRNLPIHMVDRDAAVRWLSDGSPHTGSCHLGSLESGEP